MGMPYNRSVPPIQAVNQAINVKNNLIRLIDFKLNGKRYAMEQGLPLNFIVKRHKESLYFNTVSPDCDFHINISKNMNIGISAINRIVIRPGEVFSFWKLIGKCSRKKGYFRAPVFNFKDIKTDMGGGLSSLSSMIHYLVLHSPMEIVEHHCFPYDFVPNFDRKIPFGCDADVLYNSLDYQFFNNTPFAFQFHIWREDDNFHGTLRCSDNLDYQSVIEERAQEFIKIGDQFYRKNEIWRVKIDRSTGAFLSEELLKENFALVLYSSDLIPPACLYGNELYPHQD